MLIVSSQLIRISGGGAAEISQCDGSWTRGERRGAAARGVRLSCRAPGDTLNGRKEKTRGLLKGRSGGENCQERLTGCTTARDDSLRARASIHVCACVCVRERELKWPLLSVYHYLFICLFICISPKYLQTRRVCSHHWAVKSCVLH